MRENEGGKAKEKGRGGCQHAKEKRNRGGGGVEIWIFCKCRAKAWTLYIMQIGCPRIRKSIFYDRPVQILIKVFAQNYFRPGEDAVIYDGGVII